MEFRVALLVLAVTASACAVSPPAPTRVPVTSAPPPGSAATTPTFAEDLAFLRAHGPIHVLESPGGGRVALSAKYQGRVMTSAADAAGQSLGWIHRDFIASGKTGSQFDNYGGEDRFWLGPEGGQLGLYFPPGKPYTFDDWRVPAALQGGAWEMDGATPTRAVIVPFETGPQTRGTPIVNDAYFGKVPSERLAVHEDKGFLVFTCDGKARGKIGVGPARAKPMLGSYSAQAKLLTVVQYDRPKAVSPPYVNSMWKTQKLPFSGDVVNSFNDGSPGPGKAALGGFYEIETS